MQVRQLTHPVPCTRIVVSSALKASRTHNGTAVSEMGRLFQFVVTCERAGSGCPMGRWRGCSCRTGLRGTACGSMAWVASS